MEFIGLIGKNRNEKKYYIWFVDKLLKGLCFVDKLLKGPLNLASMTYLLYDRRPCSVIFLSFVITIRKIDLDLHIPYCVIR